MSDIIPDQVIAKLRAAPPECFASDDPEWLDDLLLSAGTFSGPDAFTALAIRLAAGFKAVRAFHACRPEDPGTILDFGLSLPTPEHYVEEALRLFREPTDAIARVARSRAILDRAGQVFLGLTDPLRLRGCGHYMIHGSEALQAIAARLTKETGRDCFPDLRSRGIPTIFTCTVPIEAIRPSEIRELAGVALSWHLEALVMECSVPRSIDFTLEFRRPIPAAWIIGHRHPHLIENPHDGHRLYQNDRRTCARCLPAPTDNRR